MESNYLYRALSEGDLETIRVYGKLFKGKLEGENCSRDTHISGHIEGKKSNDGIISLTSSLSVALNYANSNSYKSENKIYTDIIAIDRRRIDESNLYNVSTSTLYIKHTTIYQDNKFMDTRHDTLTEKSKEYLYFGKIPKDAIRVLPRWLFEILYSIRNTNVSKEEWKKIELDLALCSDKSFFEEYKEELSTLIYLYCNDNYKNINDLLERNERLIHITKFNHYKAKESIKDKNSFLYKNFKKLLNELEKNSEVLVKLEDPNSSKNYEELFCNRNNTLIARKIIENLLDSSCNMKEFCSNIQMNLGKCSSLEKIFIYEYYFNKKSLEELKKLFIEQNFLLEENILDRDISLAIESLRCLTLDKIERLMILLKEEILSIENKKCLSVCISNLKSSYILKLDSKYVFPINYSGYLNSITIKNYEYGFRICENISINKDVGRSKIIEFKFKVDGNVLRVYEENANEISLNLNYQSIDDYYSKINTKVIESLFEYTF